LQTHSRQRIHNKYILKMGIKNLISQHGETKPRGYMPIDSITTTSARSRDPNWTGTGLMPPIQKRNARDARPFSKDVPRGGGTFTVKGDLMETTGIVKKEVKSHEFRKVCFHLQLWPRSLRGYTLPGHPEESHGKDAVRSRLNKARNGILRDRRGPGGQRRRRGVKKGIC